MPMSVFPRTLPGCTKNFRKTILVAAIAAIVAGCSQDSLVAGNDFMKKGDYASAVIEFKNAVQAKPDSVEARLALADALERTYDQAGAEQHLRKAASQGGDSDSLIPRIALIMLDRKESAKVISEFKDRQLTSPEADSNLRGIVAIAYADQRQYPLAEEHLKGATKNTATVQLARAQLLLAQGKKEQAVAALDSSLSEPNAPWWVLRALGRIQEASGNHEAAFQLMTRAHEAVPWHQSIMGEYAEFLLVAGKLEQAIAIRDRLKKLAPRYYWTNYIDALVLAQQGRQEESLAAALKVLAVAPDHLPANLLAAQAELQKGDVLMASTRLKKIAAQNPYSVPTIRLLAQAQLRQGQAADAAEAIKRGLGVAPTDATLLSLRADSEVMRGATREAMSTLERLSANAPGNASYLLRLSQLKARSGDRESAKKLLDQATELGKDNPAIRDQIISISMSMGDLPRIRQLADYAIKSHPNDPRSHLILAAALGLQNDNAGAWQATIAALDLQPAFQPALNALTLLAREPKQREELLARYEKAIQAKPATDQTYLEYARLLQQSKNDRSSITALLEKGVSALPTSTALRAALAQELLRAGKADAAVNVAQTGASSNNALPEATALLASLYETIGDTRLATETYRKLATNYPHRADWRLKLAELEAGANQKKEATTILRALITDRPFDPTPYIVLANLTAPDNLRESLSIARELGARESNKLTALLLEGDLLAQYGQPDEALKQFDKAIKAGATPAAQLRIVQVLDRSNRRQAADQELTEAMKKFPGDPSVLGFAAQRIRAQGNPAKAAELLQKVADKNPGNPVLLNDLAWAQFEAKLPEALKNATKAAEMAPNSPAILDTLGMAQAQAGKQAEAIATLRTAVNLAPKAATPRLHLAELYIAAGERKEGANLLQAMDPKTLNANDQETLKRLTGNLGT